MFLSSQGLSHQMQASQVFGHIIHRVAVRVGSKTTLGQRIGVGKEVIQAITLGEAHAQDRKVLEHLVSAVGEEVHPEVLVHLRQLVDEIKPMLWH